MVGRRIRGRITYANVASSVAVFIALGGTSYALTLPKDSVGPKQLQQGSVGQSEIRTGAVRSADIHNGSIGLRDLAKRTTRRLRGQSGPIGPPGAPAVSFFLVATSAGIRTNGNGGVIDQPTPGQYVVAFPRSVAGCALVGSLARVPGGPTDDSPAGSSIVVGYQGDNALIRTFDQTHALKRLPFTLIAAC